MVETRRIFLDITFKYNSNLKFLLHMKQKTIFVIQISKSSSGYIVSDQSASLKTIEWEILNFFTCQIQNKGTIWFKYYTFRRFFVHDAFQLSPGRVEKGVS